MMTHGEDVPYAKGDDYRAVVLPYTGNTVDMVVIVPDAGRFDAVERRLSAGFLKNVRAATGQSRATITMPRFDFESNVPLADLLPDMGMPDAFQPGAADFGGITGSRDLYISAALHRATLKVDEKGTEATAATVIVMDESAAVEPPPHLTIDRPFIFAITERETDAILFLGRVTNPAK
jgi:serpin B